MSTIELEIKRMSIFRRLLNVEDKDLLQKIEILLNEEELPIMGGYSEDALREAVSHSQEDIKNGRVYTMEQMRTKHPKACE